MAHFLGIPDWGAGHPAQFLGITRVLGRSRDFDEADPVEGYLAGEAPPPEPDVRRDATPLAWEPWDVWADLSEVLWIRWGDGPLATVQRAWSHPKAVLAAPPSDDPAAPAAPAAPAVAVPEASPVRQGRVVAQHFRMERLGAAGRIAKELRPLVCEGCGLDAAAAFGATLAHRAIEAHHLTPMAQVRAEGRLVDPVADFALLGATCHRLIHGLLGPDDLAALRALRGMPVAAPV